jgi:hypothetical protein
MDNQNLQNIREEIGMYFDRQLNAEQQQSLLDRVNADPAYHRVFTQEKEIRDHLKQKVRRPGVSPDLIQSIKDNIRME